MWFYIHWLVCKPDNSLRFFLKIVEFSKKEDTINLDQDVITIVISTDREKSHKKLKVFQFEFAKQDVISHAVEMTMLKNFIV